MRHITMVVIEIANNAQKHVFGPKLGSHFLISLKALPEDQVMLYVKDNGPGWSQTNAGDTDRTLGQTILKGLVDQLGGSLNVNSREGTVVSVLFPTRNQI